MNFNFSMQHDARFVSEGDSKTVISLFDNGKQNEPSGVVDILATSILTTHSI